MTQDRNENFRADLHAEEELVPFDVHEYSGRRAMWLLAITVILLLIAAITVFKLYQAGVRDRDAPPRVSADNAPFKVTPENPGGEETPNQDKTVYDLMSGTNGEEKIVRAPQPEEPVDMPKSATIVIAEPEPVTQSSPTEPAQTAPKPQTAAGSDHVAQVASVRSKQAAIDLWTKIKRDHAAVLPAGTYSDIKRVDLKEKGIYFRLRVAGLPNKDAASELCKTFAARGQACYVTRR